MIRLLKDIFRRLQDFRLLSTLTDSQLRVSGFLVPITFGLYVIWLGADSNWDLTNYHLYNPFALLHGKLDIDLAPAGPQTYFNPALDLLPYTLNIVLPPPLAGFLMGALHGIAFPLLIGIAAKCLPQLVAIHRNGLLFAIAAFGCLSANLLSEIGNSMGDDTTALFILGAVFVVLHSWELLGQVDRRSARSAVFSGLLAGAATGLKLTNAPYAIALAVALLSYPASPVIKARVVALFSVGVLLGFALFAGYWLWHIWERFGNPLYPQFSSLFPSPLTSSISVVDAHWRPRNWIELIAWPFIFTLDPSRVGQVIIRQAIWSVLYLVMLIWLVLKISTGLRTGSKTSLDPRHRFLILFVAGGYFLWMEVFSVYRYIVAIELLAPLVVLILLLDLLKCRNAIRIFIWTLGVSGMMVVLGGAPTWGHSPWADPLYQAELPSLDQPSNTFAVIYSSANAWAWVATQFPPEVAFSTVRKAFPESRLYSERIREMATQHKGHSYALIDAASNSRAESISNANRILSRFGLLDSSAGCAGLQDVVNRFHLHATIEFESAPSEQCHLRILEADNIDVDKANRSIADSAAEVLQFYKIDMDRSSCKQYAARIGKTFKKYQWCALS